MMLISFIGVVIVALALVVVLSAIHEYRAQNASLRTTAATIISWTSVVSVFAWLALASEAGLASQ